VNTRVPLLLIASLIAVLALPPAALACADSPDDTFIRALDDSGVPYESRLAAIKVGRMTCDKLHRGAGFSPLAKTMVSNSLTRAQTGHLIGAAVGAYCPDMGTALHNWVAAGEPG
jgi:Protein of unknown function (DUF732)